MARFAAGEAIAMRVTDTRARTVHSAPPQIVVRDEPDLIALFLPAGAAGWRRAGERGGPRGRQLLTWNGDYEPKIWTRTNVLMLHRPGDAHSVWLAWDERSWEHVWWYVNLEEPWRRTSIGFDTRDQELDLWADPHLSTVHWKDEDELAFAAQAGRFTPAECDALRERAARLARAIERREPPFSERWPEWRPDPRWSKPALHPSWSKYEP